MKRLVGGDDVDADTQFCLHWFEQYGWDAGKFGEADTLARAKGTSVEGVKAAGVIESGGGNIRLLKWKEYPANWDPAPTAASRSGRRSNSSSAPTTPRATAARPAYWRD